LASPLEDRFTRVWRGPQVEPYLPPGFFSRGNQEKFELRWSGCRDARPVLRRGSTGCMPGDGMLVWPAGHHKEVRALPRQDRAERTRNAILEAAAVVFDERGFNGASLSDILAKAGVTKGALYFHFSSKEELARAIVEEQFSVDLPFVDFTSPGLQT